MTDILFVNSADKLTINEEVNGTMLLGTLLLQADFHVQILRFAQLKTKPRQYAEFIREITGRILEIAPKCVSFYTLWSYYHIMLRVAAEIKKANPSIIVVFAGPHASTCAEATMQAMPFVDYVCSGEGENTVVPFFRALLREENADLSQIPGLYYRQGETILCNTDRAPVCNLNALPYWDERLYPDAYDESDEMRRSPDYFMPIDVGRGCPFSCTFCSASRFWKRLYRLKSPERIVDEIQYYMEKFGITSFWFTHDAFTVNKKLVADVCNYILEKNLNIRWRCSSRVDCLSEDLILLMKKAGLVGIELGIETGSPRMQKLVNKNLDLQNAEKTISFLLSNDITVYLFFMYGFPEETEEDLNQTMELHFSWLDLGVTYASMSYCMFTPDTVMTDRFYDQLQWKPDMPAIQRLVLGHTEEHDMLLQNKILFSDYYHLHTPVRDNYHYLYLLSQVYQNVPHLGRYIRRLYQGDNLKFYHDFVEQNQLLLDEKLNAIQTHIGDYAAQMMGNVLNKFDLPYIPLLKEALRFDADRIKVFRSKENISMTETYNFCYLDYQRKRPIEQYTQGATTIYIQNIDGKKGMRILDMK